MKEFFCYEGKAKEFHSKKGEKRGTNADQGT
jgi:hypothetical protein